MTICPHCKSKNNNSYYCKGCGRRITAISKPQKKSESTPPKFIEEVIDIIETNFMISDVTMTTVSNTGSISLGDMLKEEGITLVGGEQWQDISPKQQCGCFFAELICIYIISAIITMVGFIAGANEIEMIFQLYASSFLALSLIVWFIVPYFTGFSPVSLVLYNCSMFTLLNESVKNRAKNLFTMFLCSSVPSIFILPFLYSLLKSRFSENYEPFAFSTSEIKYMEKTGSEK